MFQHSWHLNWILFLNMKMGVFMYKFVCFFMSFWTCSHKLCNKTISIFHNSWQLWNRVGSCIFHNVVFVEHEKWLVHVHLLYVSSHVLMLMKPGYFMYISCVLVKVEMRSVNVFALFAHIMWHQSHSIQFSWTWKRIGSCSSLMCFFRSCWEWNYKICNKTIPILQMSYIHENWIFHVHFACAC